MKRTIVRTVCDVCQRRGAEESEARKVFVTLDGKRQSVDLCSSHRDELSGLMTDFLAVPKPAKKRRKVAA